MLAVSEWGADAIYTVSSTVVIVAGIIAYWSSGLREKYSDQHVADAKVESARANEGLAKANLNIEDRKKENLQLSITLEAERSGRAALEKKLSERLVPSHQAQDEVGRFKGMQIFLVSVRDDESKEAAMHLGVTLEQVGWKVAKWTNTDLDLGVGIKVEAQEPAPGPDDRSLEARDALVDWLKRSKILANAMSAARTVPPNAVRITVGRSERLSPPATIILKYETILNKGPDEPPSPEEF